MKKDFSGAIKGRVYNQIEQGISTKGQQGEASPEEQEQRKAELRTQGRKGCKASRINMAFTPENHQYLKVMATITGKTITNYTNFVIEKYREEHPEIYDQAKAILDQLQGLNMEN